MTPVSLFTVPTAGRLVCRLSTLCFWCHATGQMTIDHIISKPLWKYGRKRFALERRNYLVPACRQCNEQRAAISLAFQQLNMNQHDVMPFFKCRAKALPYVAYFRERYERLPTPLREACIFEVERLMG